MIKELVLKNRSYRSYERSVKIKKDTLVELIDIARVTPSAMNLQPLLYVPLTESYADKILPYTNWAKALKNMTLPPDGKGPGAFILLCIDKERTPNPAPVMRDVGIVAQTMLLAATEKELGGLMIGSFDGEKIKETLALDDNIQVLLCVALGKPDEKVVLEEMDKDGNINYYRDENNTHHVPKRRLEDIIIEVK
ncbi:MAG: nitroreductase family protein [Ruminococcaceae bacterium]|nr:nitroreductase family protein [Oscillospiraceae bacterium]